MIALDPSLLQAILDCPADDWPRTLAAEWLEDHGEAAMAEYVRQSLWIAANRSRFHPGEPVPLCSPSDCEWCAAKDGTVRAVHRYGQEWAGEPLGEINDAIYTYNRGFVSTVRIDLASWLAHGRSIVRQHPVERVEASDKRPWAMQDGRRFAWAFSRRPELDAQSSLPEELIATMERWNPTYTGTHELGRVVYSYGLQDAIDLLSGVLLHWAKSPTDLPVAASVG